MQPNEGSLNIEQQRELNKLCWRFEAALLTNQPPAPKSWLLQRGTLPALPVIDEFLAVRAEAESAAAPHSESDNWLAAWQDECLALLPDRQNAVATLFADFRQQLNSKKQP